MESTIISEIKEYITKNNISYNEISRRSGLSKQLLFYYLGKRSDEGVKDDIYMSVLEKICHALGFRIEIHLIAEK